MKTVLKYIGTLLVATIFFSCSKDDGSTQVLEPVEEIPQPGENPETEVPSPVLGEINPLVGGKLTSVTIKGENFGTDLEQVEVFFNDKEAEVQALLENEITAVVPAGAFDGPIRVAIRDTTLAGPQFNYMVTDTLVSTLAGSTEGYTDGSGPEAKLNRPTGIAVDNQGNTYVVEPENNSIRKISPDGTVSTLAGGTQGSADGTGLEAQFNAPWDLDVDAQGNIYVADTNNHRIRKITPSGEVSTLAGSTRGWTDGVGEEAQFNHPMGIAVTPDGIVYVGDIENETIRKIDLEGTVSSFQGGFSTITGLAVDNEGFIYIVPTNEHAIWKIGFDEVSATKVVGNGEGDIDGDTSNAQFRRPKDVAIDAAGNLYIADEGNHKIRKITVDGQVITYAGSTQGANNGSGSSAQFKLPYGLAVTANGIVYVADTNNHLIRKIILE